MKINNILFCVTVLLCVVLGNCFNPLDYKETTLGVTLSGRISSSSHRTAINEDDYLYVLIFTGPEDRIITKDVTWGETVTIQAVPGMWSISVKAVDPDDQGILRAIGETHNIQVIEGQRNTASVKMAVYSEVSAWAALKAAVEQGGYDEYIVLTNDVSVLPTDTGINLAVNKTITLAAEQDIVIESFGFSGNLFTIGGNGHLILGSAGYSGAITFNGACNAAYFSVSPNGTFTMNNGEMSGNTSADGGGVFNAGVFEMNGGLIAGNYATSHGAGVYNAETGTFVLNNGEISGNSAVGGNSRGGGVYNSGKFTLAGGTIEGNAATYNGNGVYNDGVFEIEADAFIDGNNDVFLTDGNTIHVDAPLNQNTPISVILAVQDCYMGRQILSGSAASGMKELFSISMPVEMWVDSNGKLSGWQVTTLAGDGTPGDQDGEGTQAQFYEPHGIAVDNDGNIYVADTGNNRIRKITHNGSVSTPAGDGTSGYQDGDGTQAQFSYPCGIAVDNDGNVYVADTGNHSIRLITPGGTVSTPAGDGTSGYQDGEGTQAQFSLPYGITVDNDGNVLVADSQNDRIRIIDSGGVVSILAGVDYFYSENGPTLADGPASTAQFGYPTGIAIDGDGNIYVADTANNNIRKIESDGNDEYVTTVAGHPGGWSGAGWSNGFGRSAAFYRPSGIAVDNGGNVYVLDSGNNCIRKIRHDGYVTTIAGNMSFDYIDGFGISSSFGFQPDSFSGDGGIAIDGHGNIYVADTRNHVIRKIIPGLR